MDWLETGSLTGYFSPPPCPLIATPRVHYGERSMGPSPCTVVYAPQLLGSSHDLPQSREFNLRVQPAVAHEPPCQSRDSASSGRMAAEHGPVQWQVMRGFVCRYYALSREAMMEMGIVEHICPSISILCPSPKRANGLCPDISIHQDVNLNPTHSPDKHPHRLKHRTIPGRCGCRPISPLLTQ